MCVIPNSVTVSHKMLVTKLNMQSESLEHSETLEKMGAERPEVLVFQVPLLLSPDLNA